MGVQSLHITLDRFGTARHRTVDPGGNFNRIAARRIAGKARRDLDCQAQFAVAHAPVEIGIVGDRILLDEVARTGDFENVVAARRRLVAVKHCEGQILDVHVDAVADDEHQDDRADRGKRRADGIAHQFQRFAAGIAEHPPDVEKP
ncbi:hypothetical protein D9M72_585490 [compost metagenome]